MLIDRVGVIGIVQHHAQQVVELGNERAQHAGPVHFHQGFINRVFPFEDREKRPVGRRRAAKFFVDQVEMAAQKLAGFMAQLAAILLRIVEDANEIRRIAFENLWFGNRYMTLGNAHALAQRPAEYQLVGKTRLVAVGDPVNDQFRQAG